MLLQHVLEKKNLVDLGNFGFLLRNDRSEDKEINLLTSSFGVGLSWGVVGFTVNVKDILPITIGKDTYEDGYSDDYDDDGELRKNLDTI